MTWFSNWFHRRPAGKSVHPRPTYRPSLDALEDRTVPAISHAFIDNNVPVTLAVFKNGMLYDFSPTYTGLLATGAQDVHAYRDIRGQLGMNIVFGNGAAYQFDSTGMHFLGTGVREASTTVDRSGNTLTLVAFKNGTVLSLLNGSARVMGTNFYSACTYVDANGAFGLLLDFKSGRNGKLLAQVDSTQNRIIGPGFMEAESNYSRNGRLFYLDLTPDNGSTIEFTQAGVQNLGTAFESPPSS